MAERRSRLLESRLSPTRARRPCTWAGCSELVASGRCSKHETVWRRRQDERRGTRHERGYGTRWEKTRLRILGRDNFLCQVCRYETATQVDHIIERADGGTEADGNLQAICAGCHQKKTGRSEGARRIGTVTPGGR